MIIWQQIKSFKNQNFIHFYLCNLASKLQSTNFHCHFYYLLFYLLHVVRYHLDFTHTWMRHYLLFPIPTIFHLWQRFALWNPISPLEKYFLCAVTHNGTSCYTWMISLVFPNIVVTSKHTYFGPSKYFNFRH